jgi:hypothetical protein
VPRPTCFGRYINLVKNSSYCPYVLECQAAREGNAMAIVGTISNSVQRRLNVQQKRPVCYGISFNLSNIGEECEFCTLAKECKQLMEGRHAGVR